MTPGFRRDIEAGERLTHQVTVSAPAAGRRSWKRQSVFTSALVFVSALAGIYTQAVLAATLGLSGASDAYFAALALCLFLSYVVNTSVLNRDVPELSRLLDPIHVPTAAFWRRVWRLSRRLAMTSAVIGVGLFVGADWIMRLLAPGLAGQSRDLAATSLRIMSLPLAIQLSASGMIAAQYTLQGQPLIQATALLYSAAVIGSLLWLTPIIGPVSAAIGASASFCLMFAVVVVGTLRLARRPVSSFEPGPGARSEPSVPFVTLASIVLFGQTVVGPMIASTLAEGTVAQLSFAYRPVEVLARALPAVIAYTVMPSLAAAHGRRDASHVQTESAEALRLTLGLVLPIALLLAAVRQPVVTILYQRSAFSIEAVQAVVPTLGWFALALPGLSVVVVLNAIFFSVGRERLALAMGTAILGSYVVLGLLLGRAMGGAGVALAYCLASALVAFGGAAALGRRSARGMFSAAWVGWTTVATVLALGGGTLGVQLTHNLSVVIQLAAGLGLGGLGPAVALFGVTRESLSHWSFRRPRLC